MSGTTPAGEPDAADAGESADPMDATDSTDPDAHGGPTLSQLAEDADDAAGHDDRPMR
jgi:hypothetical protein